MNIDPITRQALVTLTEVIEKLARQVMHLRADNAALSARVEELEPLIGVEEIARVLGFVDADGSPKRSTVYELSRKAHPRRLPVFRCGRELKARPSDLVAWIEEQRQRARGAR